MIRAGDTIENPVTGERVVFHRTSHDTGGRAVVLEAFLRANGLLGAPHVHPQQEERVEVLRGSVGFAIGRRRRLAVPGERLTVPAGVPHRLWNVGDEEAHVVCELRPALGLESLLETLFALAGQGRTNRRGLPSPLRLAVIARAHFDTVRAPFPPAPVQRLGLAAAAPLGRLLGYPASIGTGAGRTVNEPHTTWR